MLGIPIHILLSSHNCIKYAYLVIGNFVPIDCLHFRLGGGNFLLREKFGMIAGWFGCWCSRDGWYIERWR